MSKNFSKNRDIQALRGVAILSVAIFHFTYRWRDQLFYEKFASNQIFLVGPLGVSLFFMISGYVIFSTLTRTTSFSDFWFKRISRLIPTLIIVSPLLYFFQTILNINFFPKVNVLDMLSSILILNPTYVKFITGYNINFVTGVMWTLTYELTFYFLVSLIYFFISKKYVFELLFSFFLIILIINYVYLFITGQLGEVETLSTEHKPSFEFTLRQSGILSLSWFLIGMWFNPSRKLDSENSNPLVIASLFFLALWDGIGGRSAFPVSLLTFYKALYIVISFILISIAANQSKQIFSKLINSLLSKLGDVSYEFYLLHEVIGVYILSKFPKGTFLQDNFIYAFIILLMVLGMLWILSYYVERFSRIYLRKKFKNVLIYISRNT